MRPRPLAPLTLVLLTASACARTGDASSTFSGGPGPGDPASSSASSSDTGTSTSTTSSSSASGDASTTAATGSTGTFDVGAQPDFEPTPVGCKGKIDFLFMISRYGVMKERQAHLTAAFPQFIATIEAKFADFDYHIMVVDGDDLWGLSYCTDECPTFTCKVGEPCCPSNEAANVGSLCCSVPDYPCESLDLVDQCDWVYGSGTSFPAGGSASNKPCPIDGERRYLVKGQQDLTETFTCIATVGISGGDRLGQALTAAVQQPINDFGGCNEGFLRDDALLMVTLISGTGDSGGGSLNSEGTPAEWAQAVLDAKHGDDRSVVMLNIGYTECTQPDGLCRLAAMFPFHHLESHSVPDYGPAFTAAVNLVDTACSEFVPPPG
jgi:hypothetical protein